MREHLTRAILPVLAAVLAVMAAGCSNTAYLAQGEKLYTGAQLTLEKKPGTPDDGAIEDQLEQLMIPEPNGSFLGLFHLKLWLYNIGLFAKSLGEPPVLLSSVSPARVSRRMRTLLQNRGYFQAEVSYALQEKEKTGEVLYTVALQPPYRIGSITVRGEADPLADSVRAVMKETLVHPGDPYDLDRLALERSRIDAALKERGFFHFAPEFLLFEADSSAGDRKVDITLTLKEGIPPQASRVYTIGTVTVLSGYSLRRDSLAAAAGDTVDVDGASYVDLDKKFDPAFIMRSIFLKRGQPYNRANHDLTLNRLMNLGVFKFVNIRYDDADSVGVPRLDAHIYLTPVLLKTIRFELQGVSKSNNLAGPVLTSTFRNRNLLRGAELFTLSLEGGFETPFGGGQSGLNSYQAGIQAELTLPHFVMPFTLENKSSLFVPKTRLDLGFHLLNRLQYFQMLSLDASFGYTWKETPSKEHSLNPISFTLVHLAKTTPQFEALLKANPFLRRSYEEQFILGPNYTFVYNDQLETDRKNHLYFKGGVDLSGNLLHLAQSLLTRRRATPEDPYKIFGAPYSQYARFDIDLRHYTISGDQSTTLATRLIAGVGFAFGNSSIMPYVKQFTVGGSNSVRAFDPRSLGPGSYGTPDSLAANSFVDQAGDIKLEANMEYRFPIVSILHGALFVDAGNIWLVRDDPSRPGAKFHGSTFLDQIAVGTGFGIRFDLSFFVLRLDLAFPLRVPSLPEGERWVIKQIDFGDPRWRKDNLVLNIAIGYPY